MNPIERMLRERIGLDAASVGSSSIERTVRLRMKSLGLDRLEDYQHHLESSRAEWEELIEAVVVNETWFFRDPASFVALAQLAQTGWRFGRRASAPAGGIRLLSVACASGEEPYSLAMTLLAAGVPPEDFTIDAVDLSARALARAQRGLYGRNSFRGGAPPLEKPGQSKVMTRPPHPVADFQTRFFAATNDGFTLQPWVRQCVRFHRANIFEEDFLAGSAPYDFVFCRNLLIYFDRATQAKALNKLGRLLMPPQPPQAGCECERATSDERGHCPQCGGGPGGVLFVGPAELPLATAHGFISANIPLAFACRKAGEPHTPRRKVECHDTAGSRSAHAGLVNAIPSQTPPQPGALPFGEASRAGSPGAEPPAERNLPDLALAHQLADAGKLNEAAAVCHAHLDLHGPSAQAYYLLGLICDAGGDPAKPDGMDYYRKALYLDPNHYETLLHMALLLEKNPATRHEARTLRRRAGRVQPAPVAALGSARTGPKP